MWLIFARSKKAVLKNLKLLDSEGIRAELEDFHSKQMASVPFTRMEIFQGGRKSLKIEELNFTILPWRPFISEVLTTGFLAEKGVVLAVPDRPIENGTSLA